MPKYDTRQQQKSTMSSPSQNKSTSRDSSGVRIFQCGFGHVLVIFSHKYSLSDRVILGVVGQPNFFVVKKSTLKGGRLLIISWQGLQDDYQTYCGLISFPDEEGRNNA